MSRFLDYFPPKGTKYEWGAKALNYSPWVCRMWEHWPASIVARVSKTEDGVYQWRVEVCNFRHQRKTLEGTANDGLAACKAAEEVCEAEKALLWLPWMDEAVKAGWRPPA